MGNKPALLFSRLSCGAGCVFIELCRQMALSFGLVFYVKVVGLTDIQAGLLLTVSLTSFLLGTAVFGYLCDRISFPYVSRKLGKKKTWFCLTSFLSAFSLLMSFSRCVLCKDPSSSWAMFAYYSCALALLGLTSGGAELAHLSLIPVVAKNRDEAIVLNALRVGFTYAAGIVVYLVVWIFLTLSAGSKLSADNVNYFTKISAVLCALGLLFVVLLLIGTKEPNTKIRRRMSSAVDAAGVQLASILFTVGTNEYPQKDNEMPVVQRKASKLRKISAYFVPMELEPKAQKPCGEMEQDESVKSPLKPNDSPHEEEAAATCDDDLMTENGTSKATEKADESELIKRLKTYHVNVKNKKKPVRRVKTWKRWLSDLNLFKVSVIYISIRVACTLTYSYLALYLTDYLRFEKEAIAYFPLTLFVSGVFGSAVAKKLNQVIGSRWMFISAAIVTVAASFWFLFLHQSAKQMTYAPTVLIGFGLSGTTAMGLAFVTDLIGDDKESSGFVFSFLTVTIRIIAAVYVLVAQNFYPTERTERGEYVRQLFAVSLGVFSFLAAVMVLLFQRTDVMPCFSKPSDSAQDPELQPARPL